MKLRRIGHIFNPSEYDFGRLSAGYAQSPQVLCFADFTRVYFSTRTIDKSGKYLSHVSFAEFSPDFQSLKRVSTHEVVPLGELGCFDEHGIFPFHVVRHANRILGYTCGWSRRLSVSVETGVGLSESFDDGETFVKYGTGPILSCSAREPFLVGDAFVLHDGSSFHMWYIFGTQWVALGADAAERTYKIGHAISADGRIWVKEEGRQIIPDVLGSEECQALPSVIQIGSDFHMFFCFRESFDFRKTDGRGYRLGHAVSNDLIRWRRTVADLEYLGPPERWDSTMQCYPHAFVSGGRAYLLYNGNEFGRFGFGAAEVLL